MYLLSPSPQLLLMLHLIWEEMENPGNSGGIILYCMLEGREDYCALVIEVSLDILDT